MLKLLIDTSVWLDLAKVPEKLNTIKVMKSLLEMKEISILMPRTIVDEFERNKERVIKDGNKSLSNVIKRAKQMVEQLGATDTKSLVLDQLGDIEYKIPGLGESTHQSIQAIESIMKMVTIIETTNEVKIQAGERAINKVAPFHRNKNSYNDAILIETYANALKSRKMKNTQFAFVTHNTSDFSKMNGNEKEPHPDLLKYFDGIRSSYYINLAEALHTISPELVTELMIDLEDWHEEPRHLSEILAALEELFDKIWYNRHHNWLYSIETGKHNIVKSSSTTSYNPNETPESVYNLARKAAKSKEAKYGLENLGPWDDFEWGMLNGKMSALRWVLGAEWDFLDT